MATQKETVVHVLDWSCKSQRHVTRSTFAAQLLSGGDAADQGLLLSQLLTEITHGPMSAAEARNQRLSGGYKIPQVLYLDAMSVFAAVATVFIKTQRNSLCCVTFSFCVNCWTMVCWLPLCGSMLETCGLMGSRKGLFSGMRCCAGWMASVR